MSANLPVAIIGIGCKFPASSNDPHAFYDFLRNKGDAMTEPPKDRWSHEKYLGGKNEPGKYISPKAAFVDDLDQFDPLEFGINMKEAQHLDPSLRLIIEVAHQTLQDSGIAYKGSRTGVFVAQLLVSTDELNDDNYEIESYNGVGKCIAIRANRVSYTFDLRGPSLVVDTACSSSGTAMHLALNAIRVGEIDQAIVLGASSMVNPAHTISFSKLGVLSPTGSSKSFDASADGYARSEGFAGVLIKRLDQATKDGDRVYSVITGSAANANGRGKSLTMPEGDMQGEVIRASYKLAGREPKDAFYVELHATGTSVGDPIESNAAGKIFREGRDDAHVLRVGSVKGNLGHAEGCSFMASLIKVSLMLHNKELIPNVRFNKPNPKIKFVENKMRVQTELEPLTPEMTTTKDGKFVTSISTYGVGGANAHVVVESFESSACLKPTATITEAAAPAKPLHLFALGTLTEKSMPRWQESLSSHLRDVTDPATWSAIARDLARQARAQPYRSFAVASTLHPALTFTKTAHVPNNADRKLCLVFSGQGPQHIFMGRQLAEAYPAFLESVRESDSILVKSYAQPSFIASSGLFEPGKESSLAASGQWEVKNVVFGIVFMQMGLVDLIKSMGIEYDCVVGHSIGEVAMSYASGHLNKKQAVGVAVARAMAMTGAQGNGSMAALGVGVAQALFILRKVCGPTVASDPLSPGLWIAGINSPEAVTVAGREDLIDKLVALSKDPKDKFFAAKLRVTSAFHTPLMGPQEDVFKRLAEPVLTSSPPRPDCIRVMSTVDGKWLERPLDLSYCWDNIRQPVLFGTAIDKIVKHFGGADSVVFLEVAPHPVLKSYVEQCGGQAVSLVRRPNPKFPALNTGEHHQFLEGLGNLLLAGFSKLDFAKLSGSSAATTGGPKYEDFKRYSLPAYPYTKTSCWSESAYDKSRKHGGKGRPLCAPHFRMGVETHPWVVGHTILGSVLFPGSGYIDAILEHGAMVVTNVTVAKPLVVNGADASPNHLGLHCRDNTWEFRGSTNGTFLNGDVVFDTTYAGGNWSPVNLAVDRKSPRRFDARSLAKEAAATLQASDFYDAIPAGYNYTGHFHDHLREIYEVPDAASHGGNGYLARFEIPDSPELFGAGFCIHPGLLDAFTQTGLAMFIDYQAKTFGTTGLFVPVRIGRLARWDLSGKDNLDEELKGEVWVYFTMREWAPDGPYVTDYVVVNSDGYVILSIDEFEIAKLPATDLVPITDESILERLTTVWQPKRLIASAVELPEVQEPFVMVRDAAPHTRQESAASLSVPDMDDRALSQTGSNTDEDASNAGSVMASAVDAYTGLVVSTVASWCKEQGRAVMRVLELSAGPDCAKAMDEALTEALVDGQLSTELACLGETLEAADAKCAALDYTYARSVVIKDGVFDLNGQELESVDVIVQYATSALSTERLEAGFAKLMPSGCAIVVTSPADASSLASKLTSLGAVDLVTKPIDATGSLLFARKPDAPAAAAPAELAENPVVVFHLTHGNEGELTELSKTVRQGSELYIVGNDDAAGIGALGVAACVAAESPVFEVFSVLFENHSLSKEDRERIVKEIRLRPDLMEQHVKVAKDGSVWVRRLVTAPGDIRQPSGVVAAGNALTYPNTEVDGVQVAAYMPEMVRSEEVEVRVIALSPMDGTKLVSFVGDVTDAGEQSNIIKQTRVFGVVAHPSTSVIVANKKNMVVLPADVDPFHAASLPVNFLAAWMGLVDQRSVSASDTILIHNAAFGFGFAAVQICQRVGCEIFCTVSTEKEAKWIISELGVSAESIFLRQGVAYLQPAQAWLKKRKLSGFDVIFNSPEEDTVAYDSKIISKLGSFICIRSEGRATPTPSNFNACIIDIDELVSAAPQKITKALQIMVEAHRSIPYKVYRHVIAMDNLDAEDADPVSVFETAVIDCQAASIARVEPRAQLFNPRKSYILVGGCSELGVRIMKWMCDHGARNVFITSRRGEKALNKIDMMYVEHLRSVGCHIGVVSADAISKTDMQSLMAQASFIAPIGGVFLMTVVLRDGLFSNLTQDSFDTVYASKVEALNVLLSVISPENMDFLLLFSTVGSVFGNAGQAAYCASQLYLDRIADVLPNTISMSFPPITDSGVFKRLVMATKGRGNSGQLTKMGMSTQQVCNFIGDCLVRPIRHYVPILSMGDVPDTFPTCEPRLFQHLLPFSHFVSKRSTDGGKGSSETPAALIADLVGLSASEIQDNLAITSYGLDSLGASKLSNQLKAKFGIVVSQIQLLGSTSLGDLNNMIAALKDKSTVGAENGAVELSSQMVDIPSVLSEKLAYGENYVTEASAHQYRIWLAQAQADNEKKRTASKIDAKLSRFGATQWDTHEGYLLTVTSAVQLDIERMKGALSLVVQRHGALRTAFKYDEGSSKLMQVVYPYADFNAEFVDYSSHLDPKRAVYDHCVKMNTDPGFKLDQLPLMKTTLFDTGNKRWSFCMVIHHIIMDDASVQILFKDLFQYYMGVEDIPPVKLHYSDFSDWLVENPVKKETTEKQLGFWQKNLENIPPLYLPIAKRSETPLCEMTQIDVDIDMDIITRFNHLISNAGVTRFAGYFAAYNILLHKFSAQSTFVVGTAVTERDHSQLNNTVGFFANMLPIKTDIKPSSTFEEYLRAFKDSLFSSLENNDVTYEDIVGRVKTSSEGRTLFKHLFAQGSLVDEIKRILKLHDLDVSSIQPLPNGEEKYETLLTVDGSAGNAVLRFDNHLFSENVARMFLKAYVTVIETIVKDETIKIQDLAIIADSEQSHLIDVVSSEGPVNPIESLVHTLIEKRAAASPFLTAVEFGEETMSYAQLNARANQIARALVLQGVKADVVVAICFDRSILQILAVLAVVKAGGCFMTIDPEDPVLRKEFMIKESNAKFFLTTSFHGNQIAKQIAEQALVVELDDPTFEKRLDKIMGENIPLRNLTPSNLAYIMFTSGSTGKPKGVMIQHRSIANLVQHSDVYGFGKGARVLQSLSYIFDPFVVDVFGTLAHGGTLVLGAKEMVLGDIGTAIKKFNINVVHVTPSILAVVPLEDYPTLETVVVAGEALPKKVIDDWAGKVRLMNMYGPTEAAVDCISCEVKSSAMVGIIGRPMKNCRVYVLDENLRPAPVGVEGEIHIGGIQVSAGYLNQPDLTRSAFISNPFVSGERLYKTGDVGIIRQDNTIEYCGRKDSQIKLRGQRIELGEIEDAILHFDEIQLAACVVREVKGNPAVVAFVEFKKDANVAAMSEYEQVEKLAQTKEALKFHLAERLPRFMFPSMFIDLPSLPRTASGKVDRKLLKTIDLAQFTQEAAGDVGLPASDVETGLMAIFAPILKVEINSFGVEQDLFSVGLNSLLAVQASEAISKTFNCHMSLNNIYLRPTIRELSTVIIDAMGQDVRQIQQAEDAEQDNLIEFLPIKRKGAKPRIFLVHDVTGMSTPFMRLGAYMPNEMYAIGDKYFGQREGFADLKAMAAHYVSLIREVQPKGPYIICGYSFGGTVALSMACMLRDMGETVSRLILLDAIFLNKSEREGLKAGDWTKRSIERISENFPEISDEWKKRLRKEIRKNLEFMFDHDAEYYDGETTLVIPKDRSWYRTGHASDFDTGADDANGWRRRISNLTMKVSGGRHDTMLAPAYVKSLAKVMREIVAECPSGEDAPTPAGAAPPMVAPARTAASAAVPAMEAPKSVAAPLVAPPRVAVEARSSVPVLDADELAKISTTKTEKEKKTGLKFFGMKMAKASLLKKK